MNSIPTPLTVSIRPAVLADATEVAECLAELGYGTTASLVAEKLVAFSEDLEDAVFVAVDPETRTVVGVVSVHVVPLFHAPGRLGRITALAVRGAAQGCVVGRRLMEAAEMFAWESGCIRVEITSGDHRPQAHAFYSTIGYLVDERRFIKSFSPDS